MKRCYGAAEGTRTGNETRSDAPRERAHSVPACELTLRRDCQRATVRREGGAQEENNSIIKKGLSVQPSKRPKWSGEGK